MKTLILLTFLASSLSFADSETIKVKGMHCAACAATLKKSVCEDFKSSLQKCDVKMGSIAVQGDHLDMPAIQKAITDAGYEVASSSPAAPAVETKSATPAKKK